METTTVFAKNIKYYNDNKRIIVNKGSTRSSKTWSLLQLLYLIAEKSKQSLLISIVSESMPHLKRGCIRDFQAMLVNEQVWAQANWNATDKIYKINNSKIEFFSADNSGKVHGPSRDILFINECQNIPFETYRQLSIRTRKTVFLDYNPVEYFWVDEKVLIRKDDSVLIHSTYKDNEYLTAEQVVEIESNKHDKTWWNTYGLGITGSREGLCIKNWEQVESMPTEYKRRWIGIDFGFTNDPTAIVDVRLANGELWINEIQYKSSLTNPDISDILKSNKVSTLEIIADSAEPKSIAELRHLGNRIEGANKGKDSIKNGLDILNRYKINVTKDSLNIIREIRGYKYTQDQLGNFTNIPMDRNNHSIDAIRYVALNKLAIKPRSFVYGSIAKLR